jgi:hypothetical protein
MCGVSEYALHCLTIDCAVSASGTYTCSEPLLACLSRELLRSSMLPRYAQHCNKIMLQHYLKVDKAKNSATLQVL